VKSKRKEFFRSRRLRASVNSESRFLLTGQRLRLPLLKNTWSVPSLPTDRWKFRDSSGLFLWGAEREAREERVGRDTGPMLSEGATDRTRSKKTAGAVRRGKSWVCFVVEADMSCVNEQFVCEVCLVWRRLYHRVLGNQCQRFMAMCRIYTVKVSKNFAKITLSFPN